MYTLEEINEAAKARGMKAFSIWFFSWFAIYVIFVVLAAAKNPDLKWTDIAFSNGMLLFLLFILISAFLFYALGAYNARKLMEKENQQEESEKREEHYRKMEELLEKMSKNGETT